MYTLVIGNKNYSSWSLRAWLLLTQFDIEFEELRLRLNDDEFEQNIRHYSPSGLVPVLISGDLRIWDSLAISEYIAEQHPELNCWPKKTAARAVARSISSEMHSGFSQIRTCLPMNCRRKKPAAAISPELADEIDRVRNIWSSCRREYARNGEFLFGGFSIADAMYAPVVLRFDSYGIEVGAMEAEYMETMRSLPSLQAWISAARAETEIIEAYED
jgi:glutathione S-transferase